MTQREISSLFAKCFGFSGNGKRTMLKNVKWTKLIDVENETVSPKDLHVFSWQIEQQTNAQTNDFWLVVCAFSQKTDFFCSKG